MSYEKFIGEDYPKILEMMSKIRHVENDIQFNNVKIGEIQKSLDMVNKVYEDTSMSFNVLKKLIDEESETFIKNLQDLITFGLKAIFFDRDYRCSINIKETTGAELRLIYTNDDGMEVDTVINDGIGGGVITVIGTLMQIYFINYYGVAKIMFVDEGFSQISSQYIGRFFEFIKELSVREGLTMLIVTHDSRVMEYADSVYKIKSGKSYKLEEGVK